MNLPLGLTPLDSRAERSPPVPAPGPVFSAGRRAVWAGAVTAFAASCVEVESGFEVSGVIEQSTSWARASCPVEVVGDLYVQGPSGPVLTIEPGCEVRVRAGLGIYVAYDGQPGGLSAAGTADQPIRFVSAGREEPRGQRARC